MRLNLYWRGRDVIDIEAHVWRRRRDDETGEQPPLLQAAGHLQSSERADGPVWQDDQPAVVHAFGFSR